MRLVLASASPRRADLLRAAGFTFEVAPVDLDERLHAGEAAEAYVARLAEAKATAAAAALHAGLKPRATSEVGPGFSPAGDVVVLGADTTVVVRGEVLGKPADAADAERMLRLLSGRTHEVLTGICLLKGQRRLVHVEPTRVRVAPLSDAEIAWYVATGEPMDKAGGYAVQGLAARFIDGLEGSYSNVVGLPVEVVYNLLKELGCDILAT
jgi:septum formation protein